MRSQPSPQFRIGRSRRRLDDIAQANHGGENLRSPAPGRTRMAQRIVRGGGLRQAGKERALAEVKAVRPGFKIHLRGLADAVCTVSEVHGIQVQLQDLHLRIHSLNLQREHHRHQTTQRGAVAVHQHHVGKLLGQRAAAFDHASRPHVGESGPGQRQRIHPVVRIEPLILRRDDGLQERRRHSGARDVASAARCEFGVDAGRQRAHLGTRPCHGRDAAKGDDQRDHEPGSHYSHRHQTASATGSHTVTVVPTPKRLSTSICPPWTVTIHWAIARPSPLPPVVRTRARSAR